MNEGSDKTRHQLLWLMALSVGLAVLVNGIVWALHIPPLHPADEPQHYLYAAKFDGLEPEQQPGNNQVPRDLQALAELSDFGPHREVRQAIDLSDARKGEIDRLLAEADNPELATVYVDDVETHLLLPHAGFYDYHPPLYYMLTGQTLRLGHAFGFGVRGRLLVGRLFSVILATFTALLATLLARTVWPDRWGLPTLIGLAISWQALIAFFTSAINNEALTYLLFTFFLLIGGRIIVRGPSFTSSLSLLGIGVLAIFTKISMAALLPLGLLAIAFSNSRRWLRVTAWAMLGLFFAFSLAWLLIPLGGGESMVSKYIELYDEPKSFPPEMFVPDRILWHIEVGMTNWGRSLGNAVSTDAKVPDKIYYGYMTLSVITLISGLILLIKTEPPKHRVLCWLALAPLMLVGLFFSIDYRFASLAGGGFFTRPQYYIPAASAQMIWFVWGLTGWFKGNVLTAVAGVFAAGLGAYNLWVLTRIVSLRYYEDLGWWRQCEQIATLWPVPAWLVAGADIIAVLTSILAVAMVILCIRSESISDNHAWPALRKP